MRAMIEREGSGRLRQAAPLLLLLAVAAVLRCVGLDRLPPAHYRDIAITALDALRAASGHPCLHYTLDEGLFANIVGVFFLVFGASDAMVRLPGAIIGVLGCLGVARVGAALGAPRAGLAGAWLLAVSLWHVILSRSGFRAILLPTVLCFAVAWLVEGLRRGGTRRFLAAGAFFGLLVHTYTAARMAVFILPILLAAELGADRERWTRARAGLVAFVLAAMAVAAPMLLHYVHHPEHFTFPNRVVTVFSPGLEPGEAERHLRHNIPATLLMFHVRGDANWRHNISGAPMLDPVTGLLFLVGLAVAGAGLVARRDRPREPGRAASLLLLGWLAVMLLPNLLSVQGVPHGLRSAGVLPGVVLLAGLGWVAIEKRLASVAGARGAAALGLAAIVGLGAWTGWRYAVTWGGSAPLESEHDGAYRAAARALLSAPAGVERYVVANGTGARIHGWPAEAAVYRFEMRDAPPILLGPKDGARLALDGRPAYVALLAAEPRVLEVMRTLNPGAPITAIDAPGVVPESPVYRVN